MALNPRRAARRTAPGAHSHCARDRRQDSVIIWSPLPRPEVVGFSRLRSCAGAVVIQDDFVVRAVSLRTTAPLAGSLRPGRAAETSRRTAESHAPTEHA